MESLIKITLGYSQLAQIVGIILKKEDSPMKYSVLHLPEISDFSLYWMKIIIGSSLIKGVFRSFGKIRFAMT